MAAIDLTRAHVDSLEAEARSAIDNAIDERAGVGLQRPDYAAKQQALLLACADVLGAIHRENAPFILEEAEVLISVEFPHAALSWMEHRIKEIEEHIADLDVQGEGDLDYCAREVFLLHVLRRVVAQGEGS